MPGIRASGAREPAPNFDMPTPPTRPFVIRDARVVGTTPVEERDGVKRTTLRLALDGVARDNELRIDCVAPGIRFRVGPTKLEVRCGALDIEEIGRDAELALVEREGGGCVQMVRPVAIDVRDGPALLLRTVPVLLDDGRNDLGLRLGETREMVGRVPIGRLDGVRLEMERLKYGERATSGPVVIERPNGSRLVVTRLDGNRLALDRLRLSVRYLELVPR